MVFIFLWFIALSMITSRSIHVVTMTRFHSSFWLVFHCTVYMHYISFIHSSIHGYLDCFRILAIVNNAAANTGGCIDLFWIGVCVFFFFPLENYWVELLGHMVVLFLVFWEISIFSSIVAAHIYILSNSVQGFPFLYILINICYLRSFWWQPFWHVGGDISLWFWFEFPW